MTVLMRDLSRIKTFFLQDFWGPRKVLERSFEVRLHCVESFCGR